MPATPLDRPSHLLRDLMPPERVHDHLLPSGQWRPLPDASDRAIWEGLPAPARAAVIARANHWRHHDWPPLPASLFLGFRRDGDRMGYETPYFARREALRDLVLGACVSGADRYDDDLINGIWSICEESFWGVPAHTVEPGAPHPGLPDVTDPYLDLFAAETAGLLAWTLTLLGDGALVGWPVVVDRVRLEVQRRVLSPYRARDNWWWLGLRPDQAINNWNPWIHSNVLAANLLLEPGAAIREVTVNRVIAGLDAFLAAYNPDGGCDEGISYWRHAGGSLFECLDLLFAASEGALDAFVLPLVGEIGRYVTRMQIGGPWYVNFADGSAQPPLDGDVVRRYGQRIGDTALVAEGAAISTTAGATAAPDASLVVSATALLGGTLDPTARAPLPRDSWLPGTEVLTTRERAGHRDGLFLALKGGHNGESHNHNDIGSFIVAVDGEPVIIDVGVGTYTRQTFGPDRYAIWTMQSAWHNLPLVDDAQQGVGAAFRAHDMTVDIADDATTATLEIAGAWPAEAGITRWQRTLRLDRATPSRIILRDAWTLDHDPADLTQTLMIAGSVRDARPGLLRCADRDGIERLQVAYDPDVLTPTIEPVPINDKRLSPVWGRGVTRIQLATRRPAARGEWTLTMTAITPAVGTPAAASHDTSQTVAESGTMPEDGWRMSGL